MQLLGIVSKSVRWIVDGMNVIGCRPDGWWRDRRAAMGALVECLGQWAASANADVTVVFERPPSPPIESQAVTVTAGANGNAAVAYAAPTPTTGTLNLTVAGLPGGAVKG